MRFSDVPHFILKEFIIRSFEISGQLGEIVREAGDDLINPDFIFKNRTGVEWQNTDGFVWSSAGNQETWFTDSYLIGGRKTIVTTEEGKFLELYATNEYDSYFPVRIRTSLDGIKQSRLDFDYAIDLNEPQDLLRTIQKEHYDESGNPYYSYIFKIYDLGSTTSELKNGEGLYFRNDSVFHDWLYNNAEEYLKGKYGVDFAIRNYVNIDKEYIFLGYLYYNRIEGGNNYYIEFNNIKDYVEKCIPVAQQNSNLRDFIYIAFDMLYNVAYQTQKNLWSLIDPIECDEILLDDLGGYYGINTDPLNFDIPTKRKFIKNLPDMIKAKGTYSAMLKIWRYMTGSTNRLNVYEKWIPDTLTGEVTASDYTTWLHTSYYDQADFETGAGYFWYNKYYSDSGYPEWGDNETNLILSTKYTIEPDLSTEPCLENSILSKGQIDSLYYFWELFRPINRLQNYKLLLAPLTDVSGSFVSTYDRLLVAYLDTKSNILIGQNENAAPGTHVEFIVQKNKTIVHGLNSTDLIVDLYDNNLNWVPRSYINYIEIKDSNRIEIDLNTEISYFILLRRGANTYTPADEDEFENPFNSVNLITQFYKNEYVTEPKNVYYSIDYITTDSPDLTEYFAYPARRRQYVESPSSLWQIDHNMSYTAIFIDVLNENEEKIYPKNIKIIDGQSVEIEFYSPVAGSVLIYPIGQHDTGATDIGSYVSNDTGSSFTINHGIGTSDLLIHIFDSDLNRIKPDTIEIIDDNNISIVLEESKTVYTFIKGIVTGDIYDYLLGSYTWIITTLQHNFRQKVYQYYDGDRIEYPDSVRIATEERIVIDDDDVDKTIMLPADYTQQINTEMSIWDINHELGVLGIIVNTYDENWNLITPADIVIDDQDNCTVYFDSATKGYVRISRVADPSFEIITDQLTGSTLLLSNEQDDLSTYQEEVELQKMTDQGDFLYLEYTVPEETSINIVEMGLKSPEGNIVFISKLSPLYKREKFEMNILYKVSKSTLR